MNNFLIRFIQTLLVFCLLISTMFLVLFFTIIGIPIYLFTGRNMMLVLEKNTTKWLSLIDKFENLKT
jgi:hypothetical protein